MPQSLTPANPYILRNATQDFTPVGFTNAGSALAWKTSLGTIARNGNLGRVTAPNSDGSGTVKAFSTPFVDAFGGWLTQNLDGSWTQTATGTRYLDWRYTWVTGTGSYFEVIASANIDKVIHAACYTINDGNTPSTIIRANNGIFSDVPASTNSGGSQYVAGDLLRFKINASNQIECYVNGVLKFTSTTTLTGTQKLTYILSQCNASGSLNAPNGTIYYYPHFSGTTGGRTAAETYEYAEQTFEVVETIPDTTPPSNASAASASCIARNTNRINWTNGADTESDVVGARITRATDSALTLNVVTFNHNSATAQYDDTTAADGQSYYYGVESKNGAGLYSAAKAVSNQVTTWNAPPTISNSTQLANAQLNQSYRETIILAGGNGNKTLSETPGHSLPAWLSFDAPTNPNDLIGTHNALATNELVYLRVTDENIQYTDYVFQLTTVDTIAPSDIATLTATKVSNSQVTIASSGSTDASGSLTYENQRSSDNFVSDIVALASTAKDFSDTYQLPTATEKSVKWRQRSSDPSNNKSNWKESNAVTIVPNLVAAFTIASNFAPDAPVTATKTSTGGSAAAHTYKWRWFGTTNVLSTSANPNLGILPAGNYDLELEETDAYGTVSTTHHAFTVSALMPPVILSPANLSWGQTGHAYSYQLLATRDGVWSVTVGDLPEGALDEDGLITIDEIGDSNYVFTARCENDDGYDERVFTIPVSSLAVFDFDIDYEMPYEYDKKVRVFIPRSGAKNRQTRIDSPDLWKLNVRSEYYDPEERAAIIAFWKEHFPSKNFLFHDKDSDEYFEAWISSTLKAPKKRRGSGEFEFTIEQV